MVLKIKLFYCKQEKGIMFLWKFLEISLIKYRLCSDRYYGQLFFFDLKKLLYLVVRLNFMFFYYWYLFLKKSNIKFQLYFQFFIMDGV